MELNFYVKYDSGSKKFTDLDAYHGAQSLLGISQILLLSLNAFINKEIITQATSAKGIKLTLGLSRKGSYEQIINFVITNADTLTLAAELGKDALYELLKWGLGSAVGLPFAVSHRKAKKRVRDLMHENDDLQEKLDEALRRAHQPVKHQGLTICILSNRTELITFNDETLEYLETEVIEVEQLSIDVSISRFNARTGTGRLITDINSASIPFYPAEPLSKRRKALLADNLSLVARGEFDPITVIVSKVTSRDGKLKRYTLHGASARSVR